MTEQPTTSPSPGPRLRAACEAAGSAIESANWPSYRSWHQMAEIVLAHVAPVLAAVERERERLKAELARRVDAHDKDGKRLMQVLAENESLFAEQRGLLVRLGEIHRIARAPAENVYAALVQFSQIQELSARAALAGGGENATERTEP